MRTVTKLAMLALPFLAAVGCGTNVDVHFGGSSGGYGGPDIGYYYVDDSRYDHWWYYSDGSRWWYWDNGWTVDAGFVWHDDHDWYYYEYDPLYYDPYYDPYNSFYDDPYYWDDVYWDDGSYCGDDWYYYGDGYYDDYGYWW